MLESCARTLSSAVALRRFAWLRTTTFPFDARTLVDSWVLSVITNGYFIEFVEYPPTPTFTPTPYSQLLANKVAELLGKDAVEPVPITQRGTGFYSRYFTIPKKRRRYSSNNGLEGSKF